MSVELLSVTDFITNVLPSEVRSRAKGKPVQVVSDFDETQASTYVFSNKWNTHVPKIRADLSLEAQRLVHPMCLATARTPNEPVSWAMWHKLSRLPMPLVAENGAVLVLPAGKVTEPPMVDILASPKQVETIKQIQQELQNGLINHLKIPSGNEIVLRPGRIATVEIRSQDVVTKVGTPEDYIVLTDQLQQLFSDAMPLIDIVSSGSSLGIQPVGVSKELGIRVALSLSGVEIDDVFLVGMGDNKNDEPLFNFVKNEGGLTIGVRPTVGSGCDFIFNGGDETSLQIIRSINSWCEGDKK